jgi:hypothetical protein
MRYRNPFVSNGNQTQFQQALTTRFTDLLAKSKNKWFSIFIRSYTPTNESVAFSYVLYFWSVNGDTIEASINSLSVKAVTDVNKVLSSTNSSISISTSATECSYEDNGLSPGATAGIAIGAIAGGVAGAGALAGIAAAGYAVYRHMNRPPAPEQLASGDTAFVDNTSNDNRLFTSNQAEFQNELYSL